MREDSHFAAARRGYHAALLDRVLCTDQAGVPSNADKDSPSSVGIAREICRLLEPETVAARLAGQMSGNKFEELTWEFVRGAFSKLSHLRPGNWEVKRNRWPESNGNCEI